MDDPIREPKAAAAPTIRLARPGLSRALAMLACGGLLLAAAAPAWAQTERILLVGDSWVAQAWSAGAFDTALANKGLGQFSSVGGTTTIGGTTAAQWASAPYLQLITDALTAHQSIDIVHVSIGGNDFLGAPPGTDLLTLAAQILADQQTVIDHIQTIRPGARVTINTYDYTPAAFNTEQLLLASIVIGQTSQTFGAFTLNQLGVLHHVFGASGLFLPGETPLPGNFPDYEPIGGGDPSVPGQAAVFRDAIHPTDAGYVALAEHAIDTYYAAWLLEAPLVPLFDPVSAATLAATLAVAGASTLSRKARSTSRRHRDAGG